jgi:hypothetical protein
MLARRALCTCVPQAMKMPATQIEITAIPHRPTRGPRDFVRTSLTSPPTKQPASIARKGSIE